MSLSIARFFVLLHGGGERERELINNFARAHSIVRYHRATRALRSAAAGPRRDSFRSIELRPPSKLLSSASLVEGASIEEKRTISAAALDAGAETLNCNSREISYNRQIPQLVFRVASFVSSISSICHRFTERIRIRSNSGFTFTG